MTMSTDGTTIQPGTKVIWHHASHDEPVVITGIMGRLGGGALHYSVEGSNTGAPDYEIEAISEGWAMNGAVDEAVDLLGGSFSLPGDVQDRADEAACISVQRVVSAIGAVATVAGDLDYPLKVKMLHTLDGLIADIPAADRGPIELAVMAFLKTGADAEKFMAGIPAPAAGPVFTPYSMQDLLARPKKVWLIDQVVGAGDLVMLYGASGCGKTHVVIDLIFSACMGAQFAMRFPVVRRLNVAYAAGEGLSGLAQRFAAVKDFYSYHDPLFDYPNFTFFDVVPQLFAGEDTLYSERIVDFIAEWKARLDDETARPLDILVLDTLHCATAGADENSAQDAGIILQLAKRATKELGCAVVLVHHTTKNGETERGSSALRGAMDTMIHIQKLSDTGTKARMICAKSKDSEAWQSQGLDLVQHLESVRVWWDEPSDGTPVKGKEDEHRATMLEFMAGKPGVKMTAKTLSDVAGIEQRHAIKLLSGMVQEGKLASELTDTAKQNSNRNPLTYFVHPSFIH